MVRSNPPETASMYPLAIYEQQELLASIYFDPDVLPEASEILGESHFTGHLQLVWRVLTDCYQQGVPFRPRDLAERFERSVAPGEERKDAIRFVVGCHAEPLAAFTSANWRYYADRLIRAKTLRTIYEVGVDLYRLSQCGHAEPEELLDDAYTQLDRAGIATQRHQGTRLFGEVLDELMEELERRRNDNVAAGISTGFYDLDDWLGGLRKGEMTVLAARPGEGKTALAMSVACNIAARGRRALVVSREMTQLDLAERCIAGYSRVNAVRLRQGDYDDQDLHRLADAYLDLRGYQIILSDKRMKTPGQIAAEVRRQRMRGGLDLLVIDYLQLLRMPENLPSYEKVSQVSNAIKELALDYEIPVLALAQLNRDVERRSGQAKAKPKLSDLRDSGAIEQDADNVLFLHRPGDDEQTRQEVQLIIAKQRKGPAGRVCRLLWNRELARFENLAREFTTAPEEEGF